MYDNINSKIWEGFLITKTNQCFQEEYIFYNWRNYRAGIISENFYDCAFYECYLKKSITHEFIICSAIDL